jgi:hypothetical protein
MDLKNEMRKLVQKKRIVIFLFFFSMTSFDACLTFLKEYLLDIDKIFGKKIGPNLNRLNTFLSVLQSS